MISAVILTKNSQETIAECLESTIGLSEVLVIDTGSTDQTLEIVKKFPHITLHTQKFLGFGPMRNLGADLAKNDWILALDSDEVLDEGFIGIINAYNFDSNHVYSFNFHNYFNGKWIKWCGWYPDRHIRLYNKTSTSFTDDYVHERVLADRMKNVLLEYPIKHYSYRSIGDFSIKMHRYSTLFAKQYVGKRKSSFKKALFHGLFAFFKSYILKRGFMGGKEGYIISAYNGQTAYYKYLKLLEANECSFR